MEQKKYLQNNIGVFEPGCKILYGLHAAAGHLLSIAAEIAVQQPLHLLDFGNRCDMYFVARQLRYLTYDPAAAMQDIHLQRAFTCYQALALLRQIEGFEPGIPVIILDMLSPFLDENIRTAEVFRLFNESVELLHSAMQNRSLLIGVKPVPQKLAPDRVGMVNRLARSFGMIAVQFPKLESDNGLSDAVGELSGYQHRPAARAFPVSNGVGPGVDKPVLPNGQLSLFDLL